ncbi:MAG: Yip1 family protein [Candidatus Hodarchaeales archaeon]|jgi:hypothetical protein
MSTVTHDTITCPVCAEHIPSDYVVCPYDGASLVKELRAKSFVKIRFREGASRAFRMIDPRNTPKVIDEYVANPDRKGALVALFLCCFLFAFRLAPYLNAATGKSLDILYFIILGLSAGLVLGSYLFIFAIIFWYVISLIYHVSAKYLSGSQTATYKESQGLIGYMFSPMIIGLLIFNVILFFIVPEGFSENYENVTPTGSFIGEVYSLSSTFAGEYGTINLIFFGIFLAWGGWIVSLGTEKMFMTKKVQSLGIAYVVPIVLIILAFFV